MIPLKKAKELLQDPANSIGSIALDCGYADPGYFGHVFKQEFGVSPVEWRGWRAGGFVEMGLGGILMLKCVDATDFMNLNERQFVRDLELQVVIIIDASRVSELRFRIFMVSGKAKNPNNSTLMTFSFYNDLW